MTDKRLTQIEARLVVKKPKTFSMRQGIILARVQECIVFLGIMGLLGSKQIRTVQNDEARTDRVLCRCRV